MRVDFTRRGFIGSAASLLASAPADTYAQAVGAGCPRLVFGLLSDLHIRPRSEMERLMPGKKATDTIETDLFEKALAYYDERGVDAVVIAGDLADWGMIGQFKIVLGAWEKIFPHGRSRRDGRKVERLVVFGNHDFEDWRSKPCKAWFNGELPPEEEIFFHGLEANYERLFCERYEPIWRKEVKGYTFVGAHWGRWKGIDAVEPYFAEAGDSLKGDRPFFYVQHPQPRNTCLGDWCWGADSGQATRALSPYPNAVALSGHSHKSLVNERNVWQGAFTSVGTGTLSLLGVDAGRENAGHFVSNHRSVMRGVRGYVAGEGIRAAHGQLVNVYDGFLEIERREFVRGEPVGANWVVPVPAGKDAPFRYESRQRAERAPAPFPDGAQVRVTHLDGRVRLEFPSVRAVAGAAPAEDYEIEAVYTEGEVTRTLFTRYVYGPEALRRSAAGGDVVAEFSSDLFPPGGDVTFRIRAHAAFGHFNDAISCVSCGRSKLCYNENHLNLCCSDEEKEGCAT
ncbi:MAG: metallophosphoesterase [Kiritimatiellae bacterium]|nr:metallophosphoesterase [Kiritimatiellia bacterium]